LSLGKEKVSSWIESNNELKPYKFPLMEAFRQAEHVLSAEGEELLSNAGPFESAVTNLFPMLSTADADYPDVTLSDGTVLKATPGNYSMVLNTSNVQADRDAMQKAHFTIYNKSPNTFAAIYNSTIQRNWFEAKSRNYKSVVEASLDNDAIPVAVYTALVQTAKEGSGPLRRYQQLRKKVMKLDTYSYFDAYVPLVTTDKAWEFDNVKDIVIASVGVFGKDYQNTAMRAFKERWIDVYENEGKESGAFSQGLYDVHPYIKLNHMDTMNDVFTIAHELGHSMHSVYSDKNQPMATADYSIFVAEVASTMNEALLLDYLLETEKDPKVRAALLEQRIDAIMGTFYRQSMFADYELKAHTLAEQGKPITSEVLQKTYLESYTDFFGDSHDNKYRYKNVWARIPHFYFGSPYYVYQYATSLSASTALHKAITQGSKKDRQKAVERYIELISSGGSDHPVDLLKKAGVDMTNPATYQAIVEEMDQRVTQLEKELKTLGML
jgi:oligoendopeptidase F